MIDLTQPYFKIKQVLLVFLCLGFLISALMPPFGVFFSIITAILILSISLFNLTYFLPLLLIILLVSNSFDPYIIISKTSFQFINPFHMGVLEFINPNWVLGDCCYGKVGD